MKDTKFFYLRYCPYCRRAMNYIEELTAENPKYKNIKIEKIEESKNKEIADSYDYFYVPCFFIDGKKAAEGAMEKDDVKRVLDMLTE